MLEHCVITEGHRERRVVHTTDGIHHLEGPKHPDTFDLLLPAGVEQVGDFRIADETGTVFGARGNGTRVSGAQVFATGHITGSWEPDDRANAHIFVFGGRRRFFVSIPQGLVPPGMPNGEFQHRPHAVPHWVHAIPLLATSAQLPRQECTAKPSAWKRGKATTN